MNSKSIITTFLLVFGVFLIRDIYPCTTFCIKNGDNLIFGRNFDFTTGFGHVIINKRDVFKTSLIQPPEKELRWTSKYGSISFNQAGREFPYGGLNEGGLVIEQMWLENTWYPETDTRYELSALQWIQYHLDNSSSVDEVIASDTLLRISAGSAAPLHFLICDNKGNIATVEYIKGKMKYHKNETLPYPVLANNSYEESVAYVKRFDGFGGQLPIPQTTRSLDRFARAAKMILDYDGSEIIDYSFNILEAVSQGEATRWSILYDIENMEIHYKTSGNSGQRIIRMKDHEFGCETSVLYADIEDIMTKGSVRFHDYTYTSNRALIENVFNNVQFLKEVPDAVRDRSARYPETTVCSDE